MTIETLKRTLAWCTLINYIVLIIWFIAFIFAHDWLRELHTRWFYLSRDQFDFAHYMGMAVYKIGILLLNLVPYLALRIASRDAH